MRVIVTRPAAQAAGWVQRLRTRGIDALALPLIAIAPARDPQALAEAWGRLAAYGLVVFVSPNAAECFLAARPAGCAWPASTLAGATGPGTSQALRSGGVPEGQVVEPRADAPQFDSEALWSQLSARPWRGVRVLIVRGDGGREWLAETLAAQGAQVDTLAAYSRCRPALGADERALLQEALDRPAAHCWLFSSSESIANLEVLAGPGADWSHSLAVATHERIAERARRLGMARVAQAAPSLAAVSACIQSMAP